MELAAIPQLKAWQAEQTGAATVAILQMDGLQPRRQAAQNHPAF
jgi:hypothetical protein